MKRAYVALALLSASWLMGLNYYQEPDLWAWLIAVAVAIPLLGAVPIRQPSRFESTLSLGLALPALWIAPGIHKVIPVLIVLGCLIHATTPPLGWLRRLGSGSLLAGAILLAQALAMAAYASLTARSHELPAPLAALVAGMARLIGADAALNLTPYGYNVDLFTMRRVHPIGATWELLIDPATLCFALGGAVMLLLSARPRRARAAAALVLICVVWLPLRAGLMLGLYLHRALLTDYDAALDLMNQFFSPWTHLLLLMPPVLGAWYFLSVPSAEEKAPAAKFTWPSLIAPAAAFAAAILAVLGIFWVPSGSPKTGRIIWDEHHSKWEPTDRAYDTEWYSHEAGYNYYCIYDYCSHYYPTERLDGPIKADTLRPDDVLVVKVPTAAYTPDEITEIERFVRRGGGLMCIGEHTDVFGTGTHLNDLTRRFGFTFRFDCVFGIKSVFEELYAPPLLPHPVVQRMPPLDFEISCSIDPGFSSGRAAMQGTGLKNAFADYHASNFYPQVDDFPDSRYGAFVQMWAAEQGDGRVCAFSDSTQFSNFSTFESGKPEMFMGMVQWLRHRNSAAPVSLLAGLGMFTLLAAGIYAVGVRRRWLLTLCAALLGWAVAVPAVRAVNRRALPLPAEPQKPYIKVAVDRTVCDCVLSKAGFIGGRTDAFGIFERWILRLGFFTFRRSGDDVFDSNLIVFFHPHLDVDRAFRDKLVRYVEAGGNVLILDSPENEHSTANSLLFPFHLSARRAEIPLAGTVASAREVPLPDLVVASALQVDGGSPVAQLIRDAGAAPVTVAAGGVFGKGSVTLIGFASRFNDQNMGVTGDMEPGEAMRAGYDFEFELLRRILNVPKPATQPAPTTPKIPLLQE